MRAHFLGFDIPSQPSRSVAEICEAFSHLFARATVRTDDVYEAMEAEIAQARKLYAAVVRQIKEEKDDALRERDAWRDEAKKWREQGKSFSVLFLVHS